MKFINDALTVMAEVVKRCYPDTYKKIKYVGFVPIPSQIILLNDGTYILNCSIGSNESVLKAFVNLIVFDMNNNLDAISDSNWKKECIAIESSIINKMNFIIENQARKASRYIDKTGIAISFEDSGEPSEENIDIIEEFKTDSSQIA